MGTQNFFSCLATGDFNNDKKLDIAAATQGGNIWMLLGNGNGTFALPVIVGKGGTTIVPEQVGSTSNLDLVALQTESPAGLTILLGDGTGHFPIHNTYNATTDYVYYPPISVRDLNGDGHPDIEVLGGSDKTRAISILMNNGDGTFTPGNIYNGDGATISVTPVGILAADVNGDKKVDLAFGNGAGGISVLLGNGNGTFQGNVAYATGGFGILVGDYVGTVNPDLILPGFNSAYGLMVGKGDGTFTVETTACGLSPQANLASGVFTSSGELDLAGATSVSGVPVISTCLGNGDGAFTEAGNSDQGVSHGFVAPGDFNHDGKLDLVASDENGFSILFGNGDGTFQNGIPTAVTGTYENFAVGDFNNDGKLDVAVATTLGVQVYLGKGDGTFEAPWSPPALRSDF